MVWKFLLTMAAVVCLTLFLSAPASAQCPCCQQQAAATWTQAVIPVCAAPVATKVPKIPPVPVVKPVVPDVAPVAACETRKPLRRAGRAVLKVAGAPVKILGRLFGRR